MKFYGKFENYTPEEHPLKGRAAFLRTVSSQKDFYELVGNLKDIGEDTLGTYVTVTDDGRIQTAANDVSMVFPVNNRLYWLPEVYKPSDLTNRSFDLLTGEIGHVIDLTGAPSVNKSTITPAQARIAARKIWGITQAQREAFFAGLPEEVREDAQDAWEYGTEVNINSPLIGVMAQAFGKSAEEVQDFFNKASAIQV